MAKYTKLDDKTMQIEETKTKQRKMTLKALKLRKNVMKTMKKDIEDKITAIDTEISEAEKLGLEE